MIIAQILTAFSGDGLTTETAYHPAVADAYMLTKWTDITGLSSSEIIPGPNLYVVEAQMDAAILAALEADPNYYVLWSE